MDELIKVLQAENAHLRQQIGQLDGDLDYFRTAACFMAGYFHKHATEIGLPLTKEIDLVEWAVIMAKSRAKDALTVLNELRASGHG